MLSEESQKKFEKKLDEMGLSEIKKKLSLQIFGSKSSSKASFVAQYIDEKERQIITENDAKSIKVAEEANAIARKAQKEARLFAWISCIASGLAIVVSLAALSHKW